MAGVRAASEIHVFGARDYIIKIRVTEALQEGATLEKVMEDFIPALVRAIQNP